MKRAIKLSAFLVVVVGLAAMMILGPGRMYGMMRHQIVEGKVTAIRVLETENDKPKSYLIELCASTRELHIFASSDSKWVIVRPNEWVRVRLYPSPPWSSRAGQWQNGNILSQIAPPPEKPQNDSTNEPSSSDQEKALKTNETRTAPRNVRGCSDANA